MIINAVRVDFIDTENDPGHEIFELQPGLLVSMHAIQSGTGADVQILMQGDAQPVTEHVAHVQEIVSIMAYNDGRQPLSIVTQPVNARGRLGANVSFHVVAQGDGPLSYQWEYRTPPAEWANAGLTGNTTDTASGTISVERLRNEYRCRIIDTWGNIIYSNIVKMEKEE